MMGSQVLPEIMALEVSLTRQRGPASLLIYAMNLNEIKVQ
jgi:hypothetical protein